MEKLEELMATIRNGPTVVDVFLGRPADVALSGEGVLFPRGAGGA